MKHSTECPFCGKKESIEIDQVAYDAWIKGMLVQRAFPELTAAQREQVMTGICEPCWDGMWEEEES